MFIVPFYFLPQKYVFMRSNETYHVFTYPIPLPQAGYDTKSIFEFLSQMKLVWNQFSFSETGCLPKAKELSLPYYLTISGGE